MGRIFIDQNKNILTAKSELAYTTLFIVEVALGLRFLRLGATENYEAAKAIFFDFVLAYKLTFTAWHGEAAVLH